MFEKSLAVNVIFKYLASIDLYPPSTVTALMEYGLLGPVNSLVFCVYVNLQLFVLAVLYVAWNDSAPENPASDTGNPADCFTYQAFLTFLLAVTVAASEEYALSRISFLVIASFNPKK